MNLVFMHLMMILLIAMAIMILIFSINKKTIMDTQKSTPFECGFNPMTTKRLPFSIHFFLIAVVFLIFDIEIVVIMPMILTLKSSMLTSWMNTSIMFIMILVMGLYYEWKEGMLSWTKYV